MPLNKILIALISILSLNILVAQSSKSSIVTKQNYSSFANMQSSATKEYNAQVLSTNFTVPIARFNFIKQSEGVTKKGNITFFSSVGAGISYGFGRLYETRDENTKIINREFNNIVGAQIGFLFSAQTGENPTNLFAVSLGLNVLDFQIGYGYELGTITNDQKRGFLTIAYSIPLSKLTKGGFFILNKGDALEGAKMKSSF